MATQVQWRGGSTAEHSTFTGAAREVTVDTQKKTLVVHDGSTAGGEPLLREDQVNLPTSVTNGISVPSANQVAISTNGTGRLFVDASGNVGVGSSPNSRFAIFGDTSNVRIQQSTGNPSDLHGYEIAPAGGTLIDASFKALGATGELRIGSGRSAVWGGFISFYTDTTEKMRLTSAGRLGLGTSSPSSIFHCANSGTLQATIQNTAASLTTFLSSGSSAGGIGTSTNHPFDIYTNNQFRFRVTSAGNVGIGTNAPAMSLHVGPGASSFTTPDGAGVNFTPQIFNSQTSGVAGVGVGVVDGTNNRRASLFVDQPNGIWGLSVSYSSGEPSFVIRAASSERLRIDSSGRLLVGTSSTSSEARLLVQGGATASGAAFHLQRNATTASAGSTIGYIRFANSADNPGASIGAEGDGTWTAGTSHPTRLTFSVTQDGSASPTERMRIRSDGAMLHISSANNGYVLGVTAGAGTTDRLLSAGYSASAIGVYTESFLVWSNGNVANTNNSYGAISDIKLKENIVDANSQWDDLKALQVRKYNFKEGQTHTQIGLVAQEVELVSPGLVTESPDRDAEGNDLGTVTKSVNYSVLYMKAVKALQEAMERIETLEAKVAALEGV